jgi:hypothetical protein
MGGKIVPHATALFALVMNYTNFFRHIMITEQVIKEIYQNYNKPAKTREELNLDYIVNLLKPHHELQVKEEEIVVGNIEEFSPFKRFLIRSIYAVLEFDSNVAFVFRNHILFFSKSSSDMKVNFRPEEKKGFFGRLFRGSDD